MDEIWVEKYRPATVRETILPKVLKKTFQKFVDDKFVPSLLLSGSPGTGKTTVAKAMLEECGFDYIVINGSLNGNIDTLRVEIQNFASTVSLTDSRKYVILDEADYLNAQSTQPALRNFMEEYSHNCGFILTCNFRNRIIPALQSRCAVVEFTIPKDEKVKLATEFMARISEILTTEGIGFDKAAIAQVVSSHFPDFRRMINEFQRYAANGHIDAGIMVNLSDRDYQELITALKDRKFNDMRKWVGTHSDVEPAVVFRKLYDTASTHIKTNHIPQLVLHIADYSYRSAFVADNEINLVACLTEIMADCEFK